MTEKVSKQSIATALVDMILAEYKKAKRPVTTAEIIKNADVQGITGFDVNIKKTVKLLWQKGAISRSKDPDLTEAYNFPDVIPDGETFADVLDEALAARLDVFSVLLGRCMETWLSSRIDRKRVVVSDKVVTAAFFGVTNEAMTASAKEILKYLKNNHGKKLEQTMKDLDALTVLVGENVNENGTHFNS
jgi:hypothetical protein